MISPATTPTALTTSGPVATPSSYASIPNRFDRSFISNLVDKVMRVFNAFVKSIESFKTYVKTSYAAFLELARPIEPGSAEALELEREALG